MRHMLCKKLLLLLLCLTLSLPLTACGPKPAPVAVDYTQLLAAANQTLPLTLPDEMNLDDGWAFLNGSWYVSGGYHDAANAAKDRSGLLATVDPQTGSHTLLQLGWPQQYNDLPLLQQLLGEGAFGSTFQESAEGLTVATRQILHFFDASEQALPLPLLLVREQTTREGTAANGQHQVEILEQRFTLCRADADGQLQVLAVPTFPAEYAALEERGRFALLGPDGDLWLSGWQATDKTLYLLRFSAADGGFQTALSLPAGFTATGMQWLVDGRLAVLGSRVAQNGDQQTQLLTVQAPDGAAPQMLPAVDLPTELQGGVYDISLLPCAAPVAGQLLLQNADGLLWYDLEANTASQLLRWADYNIIPTDVETAAGLDETHISLVCRDATQVVPAPQVHLLTKMEETALADRTMLTFGVVLGGGYADNDLRRMVSSFNASNSEVCIQIVNYVDRSSPDAGLDRLTKDIINGNAPDILDLAGGMDKDALIRQEFFVDLYPYLDGDPTLSRQDLIPGLLTACAYGDTLPSLVPTYSVCLWLGDTDIVGDAPGWRMEDYVQLCQQQQNPAPLFDTYREGFLLGCVQAGGTQFVDHAAGVARFDSDAFVQLLEQSAAYPAQRPHDTVFTSEERHRLFREDHSFLVDGSMYDWMDATRAAGYFDGACTLIGYPSVDGQGGMMAAPVHQFAVLRSCQDPALAWQFLRQFLQPDYQQNSVARHNGFPLWADALAPQLEKAPTTQMAEQLQQWITTTDTLFKYDSHIANILFDEAGYYYNGIRTAEEAAAIIQDRVQTYLDEQG